MHLVHLHHKEKPVLINLDQVISIELSGYGDGTRLITSHGHIMHVDETPEQILEGQYVS